MQFAFSASRRLQHKLLDKDGNPVPVDHKKEAIKFLQSKFKKNAVAEILASLSHQEHERLPEMIQKCQFPEELIPQEMQSKIAQDYFIYAHYETVSSELLDLGISQAWHTRIISEWGEEAINVIKENPFALMNIPGMGFKRIDAIIGNFNLAKDDPRRIIASYISILEQHAHNGHTWTDSKVLQRDAAKIANFSVMKTMPDPKNYMNCGFLVESVESSDGRKKEHVYLLDNYRAEGFIAEFLADRIFTEHETRWPDRGNVPKELNQKQQEAFTHAIHNNITIITGGPGTGKTFLIKHLVDFFKFTNVAILAPTGKAAARITESTQYDASTIHRYLHLIPKDDRPGTAAAKAASLLKQRKQVEALAAGEVKIEGSAAKAEGASNIVKDVEGDFIEGSGSLSYPDNPAPHKIFIIDEISMVDTWLFWKFLRAISPDSKVILIGDSDQLPSIGSGNILADTIQIVENAARNMADSFTAYFEKDKSDTPRPLPELHAHVCRLTEPVRVDAYSTIYTNTELVRLKSSSFSTDEDFKLHTIPESVDIVAQVIKLVEESHRKTKVPHPRPAVTEQVIDFKGILDKDKDSPLMDPFNFEALPQVLTPTNRGPVSVNGLNATLQSILNLHGDRIPGTKFRIGDKVMCVRNDYTMNILNGDTGIICGYFTPVDTKFKEPCVAVKFFNYEDVHYLPKETAAKLTLAYASTVHKAQGSEYHHVIIAIHQSQTIMLNRNLFYTALTRAKAKVDLVGDRTLFSRAVHTSMPERRTTVKERFATLLDKTEEV